MRRASGHPRTRLNRVVQYSKTPLLRTSFARGHGSAVMEREPAEAWTRLIVALLLSTIGGSGFWSAVVALPAIGSTFAINRAEASLAYAATMVGYSAGTLVMARIADRIGICIPLVIGSVMLGVGYVAIASTQSFTFFMLMQVLLVGFGSAAVYTPLVADISHWFARRRAMAISICASGNTLAGALWSPLMVHFLDEIGWRDTFVGLGVFCVTTMLPLTILLRQRAPRPSNVADAAVAVDEASAASFGFGSARLHMILFIAGMMCCLGMSVPQVHLIAHTRDLGYGATRGADMLSLMLVASLSSRVIFGWSGDRIGGLTNLLIGSTLQAASLLLYAFVSSLGALYAVSALFGFVQSGIVPCYAMIVREYFPARDAASRLAPISVANFIGMSIGAWMAGKIFDLTGSYRDAFLNGALWNAVNIAIVAWLLLRILIRARSLRPVVENLPPRLPLADC
jgi:MFS family permease